MEGLIPRGDEGYAGTEEVSAGVAGAGDAARAGGAQGGSWKPRPTSPRFVDGYRAEPALRDALPDVVLRRVAAMLELLESGRETGREPWASMFAAGHGDHWAAVTEYVAKN